MIEWKKSKNGDDDEYSIALNTFCSFKTVKEYQTQKMAIAQCDRKNELKIGKMQFENN